MKVKIISYHGFIARVTVPDNQLSIQGSRNCMTTVSRKVNTSDFIDVAFQDFPTGSLGSRNGGTRSNVSRISSLFLLFTTLVR